MDFDLDDRQRTLLGSVEQVVSGSGLARAFAVSSANGYDAELDRALAAALDAHGDLGLLQRVLIADRLAELGTATTVGLALALGAAGDPGRTVAGFTVVGPTGLARFGAHAVTAVVGSGTDVRSVDLTGATVEPVQSGFGYPYARIVAAASPIMATIDADRWSTALTLVRAAEVAGAAAAAVAGTAAHLRDRVQFGKPLATLQALRHRVAEAAVSADATRWLVRAAAYSSDPREVAVAASYAQQTAAALVPDLVQLGGARSFAREFGPHVHTMRLEALRLELGGPDRLADALNATPLLAGTDRGR
jgi:hypothetical protein